MLDVSTRARGKLRGEEKKKIAHAHVHVHDHVHGVAVLEVGLV